MCLKCRYVCVKPFLFTVSLTFKKMTLPLVNLPYKYINTQRYTSCLPFFETGLESSKCSKVSTKSWYFFDISLASIHALQKGEQTWHIFLSNLLMVHFSSSAEFDTKSCPALWKQLPLFAKLLAEILSCCCQYEAFMTSKCPIYFTYHGSFCLRFGSLKFCYNVQNAKYFF